MGSGLWLSVCVPAPKRSDRVLSGANLHTGRGFSAYKRRLHALDANAVHTYEGLSCCSSFWPFM